MKILQQLINLTDCMNKVRKLVLDDFYMSHLTLQFKNHFVKGFLHRLRGINMVKKNGR